MGCEPGASCFVLSILGSTPMHHHLAASRLDRPLLLSDDVATLGPPGVELEGQHLCSAAAAVCMICGPCRAAKLARSLTVVTWVLLPRPCSSSQGCSMPFCMNTRSACPTPELMRKHSPH